MTPEQIAYVARRRSQLRYWPWLALVLVLVLAAAYGWLWQHAPLNINPFLVMDQFHHKTVSDEDLILLAARGSLAMITCGLFLLLIILLVSVALLNEQRLLRILDEVAPASAAPGMDPAASVDAAGAGLATASVAPEAAPAQAGAVPAQSDAPAESGSPAGPDAAASGPAAGND